MLRKTEYKQNILQKRSGLPADGKPDLFPYPAVNFSLIFQFTDTACITIPGKFRKISTFSRYLYRNAVHSITCPGILLQFFSYPALPLHGHAEQAPYGFLQWLPEPLHPTEHTEHLPVQNPPFRHTSLHQLRP